MRRHLARLLAVCVVVSAAVLGPAVMPASAASDGGSRSARAAEAPSDRARVEAPPEEMAFVERPAGSARTLALTGYLVVLAGVSVIAVRRRAVADPGTAG